MRRGVVGGDEGVVTHQAHVEAMGPAGHHGAHTAQAADSQSLAADLHSHEGAALPLAGPQRFMGMGNVASQRQHQSNGVLGSRHGVAGRGVHHCDAGPRGRFEVDVVDAYPGPGHDLQALRRFYNLPRDLGFAADHEGIVIAHSGDQLRLLHSRLYVNFGLASEKVGALRADGVRNQNSEHRCSFLGESNDAFKYSTGKDGRCVRLYRADAGLRQTLSARSRALPNWVRVRQAVRSSSQFLTLASPTRRIGRAELSAFNPSDFAVR